MQCDLQHFVEFQLEDGTWVEDAEQMLKIKANFVISAFGSTLSDSDGNYWSAVQRVFIKSRSFVFAILDFVFSFLFAHCETV